jgi:DNA-binding NarL/FixJ family response regulator
MTTLSEKDRQILELRVEGYTYQEIADKVGYKTHSTVKKRIDKIGSKFQENTNTDIGFE